MFGRILLAVDGSPQSDKAADLAAELAAAAGNEVVVTHVIELLVTKIGPAELELREDAQQLAERCAKQLADAGVNASIDIPRALSGRVGKVLVDAAAEHQVGLTARSLPWRQGQTVDSTTQHPPSASQPTLPWVPPTAGRPAVEPVRQGHHQP